MLMMRLLALLALATTAHAWVTAPTTAAKSWRISAASTPTRSISATHLYSTTKDKPKSVEEETTEKYGLEVGLMESLKKNDGESAKSLLKKYGIAYLATSIPLALISFGICYVLVDNGVNVGDLLEKVGINSGGIGEKAGTFAIAYAAHKAASPIRFPPTVLLTPVVAKLIGREPEDATEDEA